MNKNAIRELLRDTNFIKYNKAWNPHTGGVMESVLLQQIWYWHDKAQQCGNKNFYKFIEPCNNKKYKEGDSWCEELGFSTNDFRKTIKNIAFKRGKTKNLLKEEDAFVIYYTQDNLTYWWINEDKFFEMVNSLGTVDSTDTKRTVDSTDTIPITETTQRKAINSKRINSSTLSSSSSNREKERKEKKEKKRKSLQKMIDDQGAGFKKTETKPKGRNARAFTNQARARAGNPPMKVDEMLSILTYWQKNYNLALDPRNATQRKYLKKLLETHWKNKNPKQMIDKIFNAMNSGYMPAYINPKEFWDNYTRIKLKINNK